MSKLVAALPCGCSKSKKSEKQLEAEAEPETPTSGEKSRIQWSSPTEFLLTCIGYSVGLGNVWRFPYLCYKSGGGAFLIPYIIMMILIGMPLLFMEYAFGQFFGIGSLSIFKKVCPLFQGIGIGYITLNGLVCVYYNVIIALSLYYLFASFRTNLLWGSCDNWWNTERCGYPDNGRSNITLSDNETMNGTIGYSTVVDLAGPFVNVSLNTSLSSNSTDARVSPSEEFFRRRVLNQTADNNIDNLGSVQWEICLCLLLAWILVVIFVSKGIRSTGKVAYFTATFPYVMLTVLVVRGVTLPGASKGILYFITPDWYKLRDPEVWFGAATQLFYSTNIAWGGMITMASYNEFRHNCYRDAIMINFVSFFTSIYAGFAVFSIIGYMANEQGLDVSEVINSGPGLAFVVYPRALSLMPLAPMWSALFFFMLFLLGVGSQMVLIETVVTGFVDEFPILGMNGRIRLMTTITCVVFLFILGIPCTTQMVQVETIMTGLTDTWPVLTKNWKIRLIGVTTVCTIGFLMGLPCATQMVDLETVMSGICDEFPLLGKHRFPTLLVVSTVFFLMGLPQTTQGGMFVLQLMDWFAAAFCLLVIAVFECVVINWIYTNARFSADVKAMLGRKPAMWWRICWMFIAPLLIVAILIFSFVQYDEPTYGDYVYPVWAQGVGWVMALSSVVPIFVVAGYKFLSAEGLTLLEKWNNATRAATSDMNKEAIELDHPHKDEDVTLKAADDFDRIENMDDIEAQKSTLLNAEKQNHVAPESDNI